MATCDAALRDVLKLCLRRRGLRDLLEVMTPEERGLVARSWPLTARDDQLPPDFFDPGADWRVWLFIAGRGAGKTRAGAEWVRAEVARAREPLRIALVAPTLHDARSVMVEGVSGLLAVHEGDERPEYEPSRRLLTWRNGCRAQIFSADEPGSLRGPQFHLAWCDEIARWQKGQEAWDMLMFALRLGERPRVLATTTPAPVPLVRRLVKDPDTWISRAGTADNAAHLPSGFLEAVRRRYGGTRIGRQELEGELIEDNPDALFRREFVERARMKRGGETSVPVRVVVAVDPPATTGGNACGIIAAGCTADGHFHVLEDATVSGRGPAGWARAAVACYHRHAADRLVAEINQGGDMVEAVIRRVDPCVSFRAVRATRGKAVRAEPVAALYEQGRVHHVAAVPELEEELLAFEEIIAADGSPDRADALIWAITELSGQTAPEPRVRRL